MIMLFCRCGAFDCAGKSSGAQVCCESFASFRRYVVMPIMVLVAAQSLIVLVVMSDTCIRSEFALL